MNLDAGNIIAVVALAWSAATTLIAGWLARQRATRAELGQITARVDRMETTIHHMPSSEAVTAIQLDVAKLSGELGRIAEALKPVARSAERIEQYLMEQTRK